MSQLKRTLSTCILHGSLEEHVFNKYPESSCGVLNEDVGYGAYDFSLLYDGASAHALDDSSGGFQEGFVGDL